MAMKREMTNLAERRWRIAGWSTAVAVLAVPFVAMRFTDEVKWTASDFLFAGGMFLIVGLLIELTVRRSSNWSFRGGVVAAVMAGFLVVWANGAVGMIGNEDNGYNLLFGLPILVAVLGSVAARFEARGMSVAMLAAALVHVGVALGGIGQDPRGTVFSILLSVFWLASAALLRGAATRGGG